jgi:hypothetical protein
MHWHGENQRAELEEAASEERLSMGRLTVERMIGRTARRSSVSVLSSKRLLKGSVRKDSAWGDSPWRE